MKILNWIPAIFWGALIFFLSTMQITTKVGFQHSDLVFHAIFYSVFSFLIYRGLLSGKMDRKIFVFAAIILAALCGAFLEIYQSFLPTREASFLDGVANTVGSIVGVLVYRRVYAYRTRKHFTQAR